MPLVRCNCPRAPRIVPSIRALSDHSMLRVWRQSAPMACHRANGSEVKPPPLCGSWASPLCPAPLAPRAPLDFFLNLCLPPWGVSDKFSRSRPILRLGRPKTNVERSVLRLGRPKTNVERSGLRSGRPKKDERRTLRSTFGAPRDERRTPDSTFGAPKDEHRTLCSMCWAPKYKRRTRRSPFVVPQDERRTLWSTFVAATNDRGAPR